MKTPLKVELEVTNLEKSLAFYQEKLGFKIEYTREENKFAAIHKDGIHFMVQEIGNEMMDWKTGKLEYPFGRGVNFTLKLDDIEMLYLNFTESELSLKMEEHWFKKDNGTESGVKEFLVQDPDGYLLRISKSLGDRNL